ncbi:serine hydrolase domain-containing protein [Cytobacillus sp. Hm23]
MSFALVDKNGIIYSKGFGFLDVTKQSEFVDENTNFVLGSLSKVFVPVAILQLEEQGFLSIDDPVVKYLPWFTTKDPDISEQILIKYLFNHSSGLPSRLNVHEITSLAKEHIIDEINDKLQDIILVSIPGQTYEYRFVVNNFRGSFG